MQFRAGCVGWAALPAREPILPASLMQGGQQWLTDVQALVATFQPYTRRPEAHFKELLDSAKLLALDGDMVSDLQQVLIADVDGLPARQQLRQLGIVRLSSQQAHFVLRQRM